MNPLACGLLAFGLVACGLLSPGGACADQAVKALDFKLGAGVVSIATRADKNGFVAATANCKIIYLDEAAAFQSQQLVDGCKLMFTVHVGRLGAAEAATASIYTGHGVVLSNGKVARYKTHDAAVTDAVLAFGGLLTASDDGSVVFSMLNEKTTPKVLVTGQGVAREIVPDPSADPANPGVFVAFDSGRVVAVTGARVRTFEPGVGRINGFVLSKGAGSLFVGGFNGHVRRIDLASGAIKELFSAGADVNAIAFDDASSRVAVASDTGDLVVIDAITGRVIDDLKLSNRPLGSVALSAGGRRAISGDAGGMVYRVELPDEAPPK